MWTTVLALSISGCELLGIGRARSPDAPTATRVVWADAGTVGAPSDAGLADAGLDLCEGVTCMAGARCDRWSGACECGPGFVEQGGACAPGAASDPAMHGDEEVCRALRVARSELSRTPWIEGSEACDPGVVDPRAIEDTLLRMGLYRWLAGLPAVPEDPAQRDAVQACAVLTLRNRALSHTPPPSWTCWSELASTGAATSSIALGVVNPADALDLYVDDPGFASLGHRRWMLSARMTRVGVGFAGGAQCLGVLERSGAAARPWVAWPAPGAFPIELAPTELWSFHTRDDGLAGARMRVTRVDGGQESERPGVVTVLERGYGEPTISYRPLDWRPLAGATYRVQISGLEAGDVSYETRFVDCE